MVEILVAGDEHALAAAIAAELAGSPGCHVRRASGACWSREALARPPDLLLGLDETAFLDGIGAVRRAGLQMPVIVITRALAPGARLRALCAGADDAVDPPCPAEEILLRAARLMRRDARRHISIAAYGLMIDRLDRRVWRDGREIRLLPREYQLLLWLADHPGTVFDRRQLLAAVWKLSFDPGTNVLEVHMSRLRAKLDRGFGHALIETVKGQGYRFAASPEISDGYENLACGQVTAAVARVG